MNVGVGSGNPVKRRAVASALDGTVAGALGPFVTDLYGRKKE